MTMAVGTVLTGGETAYGADKADPLRGPFSLRVRAQKKANKPALLVLEGVDGTPAVVERFLWIDGAGRLRQHTAAPADSDTDGRVFFSGLRGTVAVDPPSLGAATAASVTVTISGAAVGDTVWLFPPSTLEDGLILQAAEVTAANTVTLKIFNARTVAVDGVSRTWRYVIIK
jgi:hypothetical protein